MSYFCLVTYIIFMYPFVRVRRLQELKVARASLDLSEGLNSWSN